MNTTAKPIIVVHGADNVHDVPRLAELSQRCEIRMAADGAALNAMLPGADVLLGWNFSAKDLRMAWKNAAELRWIHWCGAGVDAALFPELVNSEVCLSNVRGLFAHAMAEYTLGLIQYFAKGFGRTIDSQQHKRWDYRQIEMVAGREVLVVGVGSIGRAIGKLLQANHMQVVGVGRTARPDGEHFQRIASVSDLDTLLPKTDYVVLITPLTPTTAGLFQAQQFKLMRNTSRFINLGRGALVNEAALTNALRQGEIAGAALDVFEQEPLPTESPLWGMQNVFVSPHLSGAYIGYHADMADIFLDNFERYVKQQPLRNLVDKQLGFVPD